MNRTTAIILTFVTTLFCGCPGLFMMFMGTMFAVISFIPNADINIGGSSEPMAALITGLGMCCTSVFFVLAPILVGFFTLRRQA